MIMKIFALAYVSVYVLCQDSSPILWTFVSVFPMLYCSRVSVKDSIEEFNVF